MGWLLFAVLVWGVGMAVNMAIARRGGPRWVPPVVFGLTLIAVWECIVKGFEINQVLLPAPSAIAARFVTSLDILWVDFVQTVIKGGLSGYAIGCGSAFLVAIAVDRFDFLKRGLLPVGNFVAALPVIGMAPILVMWFGFDWQSKAAVVVVMVFLMRTYAAGYWKSLFKLRLPAAMPFIFNGLKIGTTLALIGAIVAEFFGSPVKGMGFRISTSVGQLALDLVWAEIVVAAIAGSAFYGAVAWIEKTVTFWHPSQRT